MVICKNCIYVDICDYTSGTTETACGHFKDSSKFIELPFNIGDIVYCLVPPTHREVTRIIIEDTGIEFILNDFFVFSTEHIGKTVFLTKEELKCVLQKKNLKTGDANA